MEIIGKEGKGVLIYMRHSEKGASLLARLKSYQNKNEKPGEGTQSAEQRDYGIGAQILRDLSITKIRLITNHPKRRVGLVGYGLEIVENISLDEWSKS
jgi:3,4-dihydroxy 2-butanone 4-phosphate synthase/GTP cyclohydrolase II